MALATGLPNLEVELYHSGDSINNDSGLGVYPSALRV